jgi:hypothetical protein
LVLAITAALVTAGVLGLWFASTRPISILAVTALAFLFPWLAVLIVIGSVAVFYVFHISKAICSTKEKPP